MWAGAGNPAIPRGIAALNPHRTAAFDTGNPYVGRADANPLRSRPAPIEAVRVDNKATPVRRG